MNWYKSVCRGQSRRIGSSLTMQIWRQVPLRTMQLHGRISQYPGTIGPRIYSKEVCSRYRRMERKQEKPPENIQEKMWSGLSVENKEYIALIFNTLPTPHL